MIINSKVKDLIPITNLNNVYVVADFDRTITTSDSESSWKILASCKYATSKYKKENKELFEHYYPIESSNILEYDYRVAKIEEWFQKSLNLFVKYKLPEDAFFDAAKNIELMKPRTNALEFLKYLHNNNIPLIIFSAGVGNIIEDFLKNYDCYYDNIYIISNIIDFKDGIAVGTKHKIIHTFNKNESSIPRRIKNKLKDRDNVVLIGDHIGDITMVDPNKHKSVIKIGLATPELPEEVLSNYYDIILNERENYKDILNLLFK